MKTVLKQKNMNEMYTENTDVHKGILSKFLRVKSCFYLIFLALFLSACSSKQATIPLDQRHDIQDVRTYSQNPLNYLTEKDRASKDLEILKSFKEIEKKFPELLFVSQEKSYAELARFYKNFFAAWNEAQLNKDNIKYFKSFINVSYERRGYAENLQKWTDADMARLVANANYDNVPNFTQKAIIVRDTDLRVAPTVSPYFYQPKKEGDAYPFDMFQNSSLSLGTPVKIFHVSRDGQWYYIECASASGWVNAHNVAFVDEKFIKTWKKYAENFEFVAFILDDVPVIDEDTRVLASLGSIFPYSSDGYKSYKILVPYVSSKGYAKIDKVKVEKECVVQLPLPFVAQNVALIAQNLMGNLYGWGGLYGNRDCSSTLQDLFTPFGIYLPRNSRAQAIQGKQVSLANLTVAQKDASIIKNAIPFQTLIYMPGHIGLYVGEENNKALMLHNMWGIRLEEDKRYVVGKTIISTLYPGMEHPKSVRSLMERVQSFNIIAQ